MVATLWWLAFSVGAGASAGWVFHRWSVGSPRLHRWMDDPADRAGGAATAGDRRPKAS
ncbi:MAG TPA: hypothetical protein VFJ85_17325 [Acidimicrobiales bacterium]|nr:hypothetical protein [Acidimicrobiales bacterium]